MFLFSDWLGGDTGRGGSVCEPADCPGSTLEPKVASLVSGRAICAPSGEADL